MAATAKKKKNKCSSYEPYMCSDGRCVVTQWHCASDAGCQRILQRRCPDGSCISVMVDCPGECGLGNKQCDDGQCLSSGKMCPEDRCHKVLQEKCADNMYCYDRSEACDGKAHCLDGSDEAFGLCFFSSKSSVLWVVLPASIFLMVCLFYVKRKKYLRKRRSGEPQRAARESDSGDYCPSPSPSITSQHSYRLTSAGINTIMPPLPPPPTHRNSYSNQHPDTNILQNFLTSRTHDSHNTIMPPLPPPPTHRNSYSNQHPDTNILQNFLASRTHDSHSDSGNHYPNIRTHHSPNDSENHDFSVNHSPGSPRTHGFSSSSRHEQDDDESLSMSLLENRSAPPPSYDEVTQSPDQAEAPPPTYEAVMERSRPSVHTSHSKPYMESQSGLLRESHV